MTDARDWNAKTIAEFRANEGKVGGYFEGAPMLLVHHRGRKSGREYVTPTMYLPHDTEPDVIYLFATNRCLSWANAVVVQVDLGGGIQPRTAPFRAAADRGRPSYGGEAKLGCLWVDDRLGFVLVTALSDLVRPDRYPRSAGYDPAWLLALDMGPNPLWLLEDLAQDLDLRPGMRILDLGSGKGATSVFLAREYGVQVVAADWWIAAEEAAAVFAEAGVGDQVTAVRAEAHALPFEQDSFDAVVSVDAFEYFGTADNYLPYLVRFLRTGGQLGMATPAMTREVRELGVIPPHIKKVVGWEAIAWHTAEWWRFQWEITELVEVTSARLQQDAWRDWLLWARAGAERQPDGPSGNQPVIDMLTADGGEFLSFALVTARKNHN